MGENGDWLAGLQTRLPVSLEKNCTTVSVISVADSGLPVSQLMVKNRELTCWPADQAPCQFGEELHYSLCYLCGRLGSTRHVVDGGEQKAGLLTCRPGSMSV